MKSEHVIDLASANPLLRAYLARREPELAILKTVRKTLPTPVAGHCLDANLDAGILILTFDSPAWVTRARFLAAPLEAALRASGVTGIRFRARPEEASKNPNQVKRAPRRLSAEAAAHLLAAAEHLSDPELAETFRRLARHHGPGSEEPD